MSAKGSLEACKALAGPDVKMLVWLQLPRYEKLADKVLADSTVAGQEACLQYLASCAALQQWEQSALAYLLLHTAQGPMSVVQLSEGVESLLEETFKVDMSAFQEQVLPCEMHRPVHCMHTLVNMHS